MEKVFKLVKNEAFGEYYLEKSDFTSDKYEMDGYFYTDLPVFTGTITEIVHFFVKMKADNIMKGCQLEKLDTQDMKYINNQALSLIYEYKYLTGMIEEC